MADNWDAEDYEPPAVVNKFDGEDVEDVPEAWDADKPDTPPPEPEKPKVVKKKKYRETNNVVEDESHLSAKEREERAKLRELADLKDTLGSDNVATSLNFGHLETKEEVEKVAACAAESIRENKDHPQYVNFVVELFNSITFEMDANSVRRIGKNVTAREKALQDQEKEKQKKKKTKPQLGAGKSAKDVLDDVLDGDFAGGRADFDEEDFM